MLKEVYFDLYCGSCIYKNLPDTEHPCDECLAIPARDYSHQPEYYKEKGD